MIYIFETISKSDTEYVLATWQIVATIRRPCGPKERRTTTSSALKEAEAHQDMSHHNTSKQEKKTVVHGFL
jgi:hypothetical protein